MIFFYFTFLFGKKCYLAQHKKQDFTELKAITHKLQVKDIKKITNTLLKVCTDDISLLREYFDKVEEDYSYKLAHLEDKPVVYEKESSEEEEIFVDEIDTEEPPDKQNDSEVETSSFLPDHLFKISKYTNTFLNNYFFNFPVINLISRFFAPNRLQYTGKNISIYMFDKTNLEVEELKGRIHNLFKKKDYSSNSLGAILAAGRVNGFAKESDVHILNTVSRNNQIKLSKLILSLQKVPLRSKTILFMSVYGVKSEILNEVLEDMYRNGVFIISAAGNNSDNACLYSPPSSMYTISVGSVNDFGNKSVFSNYGNCVTLYTLGTVGNFSGTSISAAIFTGLVAMYMNQFNYYTNNQIREYILRNAKFINSLMLMEYPYKPQVNEVLMVKICYLLLLLVLILIILVIFLRKKSELIVQPIESDSFDL